MKITTDDLIALHACDEQVALFSRIYPDGVELLDYDPERQRVLDEAARNGFYVGWFLSSTKGTGYSRKWLNDTLTAECHYTVGQLNDAEDVPGVRVWRDGALISEQHYNSGWLNDVGNIPAWRDWRDGVLTAEYHYKDKWLNDAGGIPAVQVWRKGVLVLKHHYIHGQRQNPPRGENRKKRNEQGLSCRNCTNPSLATEKRTWAQKTQ